MFLAILQAIAALPQFLSALRDFGAWMEKVNFEAWLKEKEAAFQALDAAETTDQKIEAAKKIQEVIKKL